MMTPKTSANLLSVTRRKMTDRKIEIYYLRNGEFYFFLSS